MGKVCRNSFTVVSVEDPCALSSAYPCTGADSKPFRGYYHPYLSEDANLKGNAGCFPLELTNQDEGVVIDLIAILLDFGQVEWT